MTRGEINTEVMENTGTSGRYTDLCCLSLCYPQKRFLKSSRERRLRYGKPPSREKRNTQVWGKEKATRGNLRPDCNKKKLDTVTTVFSVQAIFEQPVYNLYHADNEYLVINMHIMKNVSTCGMRKQRNSRGRGEQRGKEKKINSHHQQAMIS